VLSVANDPGVKVGEFADAVEGPVAEIQIVPGWAAAAVVQAVMTEMIEACHYEMDHPKTDVPEALVVEAEVRLMEMSAGTTG
jgi:hypothetical protein